MGAALIAAGGAADELAESEEGAEGEAASATALSDAQAMRALLLARSARDCSVLVALRFVEEGGEEEGEKAGAAGGDGGDDGDVDNDDNEAVDSVEVELGGGGGARSVRVEFAARVVDLDEKCAARLPKWARDEARVRAAFRASGEALFAAAARAPCAAADKARE